MEPSSNSGEEGLAWLLPWVRSPWPEFWEFPRNWSWGAWYWRSPEGPVAYAGSNIYDFTDNIYVFCSIHRRDELVFTWKSSKALDSLVHNLHLLSGMPFAEHLYPINSIFLIYFLIYYLKLFVIARGITQLISIEECLAWHWLRGLRMWEQGGRIADLQGEGTWST